MLHEPRDVQRRNFGEIAILAFEPERKEAIGKSPAMID
jgi:hypothetical protein